jgi:Cu/Ag efflux pump CusA
MASLVVALTVTPALSALLLPKAAEQSEPPFITWLKRHYASLMESLMLRPIPVIAAAAFLCIAAACALPFFGSEFLPDLKEGHFIVHMSAVPGTSVNETLRSSKSCLSWHPRWIRLAAANRPMTPGASTTTRSTWN